MQKIYFDYKSIEAIFEQAEEALFDKSNVLPITYTNFDCTTFDKYNKDLLGKISGNSIVYCIWTSKDAVDYNPKYIGHAGKNISRQRIRNHLTKKDSATGAQLENIKNQLLNNNSIGLSYLIIEPAYMRKALEDWLIDKNSFKLDWNNIGKRRTAHNIV
ncbi:GIY-YIG nuclease family protein [Pontibacter cellulosilyticus]|uniref:GIY-YIG nuclease family protein n=1 Tax=Pontibacter cellulosilyticus TaxID=1720253 RepID=A0A923N5B1_9BACT|nr:GIY-YIG nuclease family protein [Pontibacter cellulosilyticus]MBC5992419.1 GIY-YIG nuclease family protein [Pontibacter cellulosilyticus]